MRGKVDILTNIFSQKEILKHIAWLENEIDTCLLFDLPTHNLESDLNFIKEVLCPNKTVKPNKTVVNYLYNLFHIK